MKLSNNTNILPFYSSADLQSHKQDFATFGVYPLIATESKVPPFQLLIPESLTLDYVYASLLYEDGSVAIDAISFTDTFVNGGCLHVVEKDGYALLINSGTIKSTVVDIPDGRYMIGLYIDTGGSSSYSLTSEVITFMSDVSRCLKIEYWDNEDFEHTYGVIDYSLSFKNFVYLQTEVGRPDYQFEEDAIKRDGYTFIEKQISEKRYKFEFLAPEYLCDALRIVRMHDNILITNKNGIQYNADSILFTVKWQDGGDIAAVEAEFSCDTVIKKIGKAFTPTIIGDFDASFNESFNSI